MVTQIKDSHVELLTKKNFEAIALKIGNQIRTTFSAVVFRSKQTNVRKKNKSIILNAYATEINTSEIEHQP